MKIRHHSIPVVVTVLFLGILSPALADDYEDASRLLSQGKHAAALQKVDAAISSNPQDARARFLKGLILTEQNKTEEAIQVFTSLTRDYPELPEPYNNLAVLYAAQGQYALAQESLEMAIRTHPSYAVAHENLGDVYAKMASEAYDKALSLDRSNQTAQTKLALIRELFGGAQTLASESVQSVAAAQVTPKPAPQSAPVPTTAQPATTTPAAAATPAADQTQDVIAAVDSWAKAWSAKDTAGYLSHYSPKFDPAGTQSRKEWENTRRIRLSRPKFIEISVSKQNVSFSGNNNATIRFQQHYKSDTIDSVGQKTLKMVKSNERWLIVQERFKN
jgi:tetratricopeptide (TPR) repeat protein